MNNDGESMDLSLLNFVASLDDGKEHPIFNYSVFCNRQNNKFYVRTDSCPIDSYEKINKENIESIKKRINITEGLEETSSLLPNSIEPIRTFKVFVLKNKDGKLQISINRTEEPIRKQLPSWIKEAIQKIYDDIEENNSTVQEQLQKVYTGYFELIKPKDSQ